ncbi:dihydrodipicolinate reductase [Steroidobacter flavus]|uniref:Dihydrodipicolinate reductase n=1 Tax=Steroidobacter flavus TaxID=1842136 RepID=A0ABV8T6C8_9GAMM
MRTAPYKVVQWATGNIGTRSLRSVIEHPNMRLVGLYVHSKEKAGRDAGELCGLAPVGVKATNSIDDVLALKPDCVLYMQQGANIDDLCRLLASGANVVTTRVEFHDPLTLDLGVRQRLEEACKIGGTSLHSTGSSPGFITEALPIVLLSLQRRLDGLTINEFADVSSRNSPDMLFKVMGFGQPPAVLNQHILAEVKVGFANSFRALANAIAMPLDSVEIEGECATVRNSTRIAAGVIEKGTVGALRITVSGMRQGRALMRMRLNWYCSRDIEESWDLRESGWHVVVEGDVPLDVSIRYPIAIEKYAQMTPGLTAHRAVNAVPVVCEALPGIRTTAELSQVVTQLG